MDDNSIQSDNLELQEVAEETQPDSEKSPEELKKEEQKQALKKLKDISRPRVRHAEFWRRVAAFLLDAIIPVVTAVALYFIIVLITPNASENAKAVGVTVGIIAGILVFWMYNALSESGSRQATPGKAAFSIKVISRREEPLTFDRTTGRTLGKIVSCLILGIGFLMCLFTKNKQCLHDKMVDCLVVRER